MSIDVEKEVGSNIYDSKDIEMLHLYFQNKKKKTVIDNEGHKRKEKIKIPSYEYKLSKDCKKAPVLSNVEISQLKSLFNNDMNSIQFIDSLFKTDLYETYFKSVLFPELKLKRLAKKLNVYSNTLFSSKHCSISTDEVIEEFKNKEGVIYHEENIIQPINIGNFNIMQLTK